MKSGPCPDCGRPAAVAHGYIYANGDAYALYFVDWCEAHDDRRLAFLTLAFGEWADGSTPAERRALCVQIRADGMALMEQPFRDRPEFFGRFVPRAEAQPDVDTFDLWHVADHVVLHHAQIARVMSWILGEAPTALKAQDTDAC